MSWARLMAQPEEEEGGEDEEMPAPHETGEELAFTGRYTALALALS